jgi:hypothetical protein
VDGICGLLAEWDREAAARQAEIDRLQKGIDARIANRERLKGYMMVNLAALDMKAVETPRWKVARRASTPSVHLTGDVNDCPSEYIRVKTVVEADRSKALRCWRDTGKAPAGFEVRQGEHLRIT